MPLDVEILRQPGELPRVRAQWEELYAEAPEASPYQCYEWIESDARFREGQGENGLRVCVVKDGGRPIAIFPLALRKQREAPWPHRSLRWAGGGWGTFLAGIVPRSSAGPGLLDSALAALARGGREWSYCRLDRVPRDSPHLFDWPPRRHTLRSAPLARSIVIHLPQSWEAYRSGLSPNHRKNVSRRINQLRRKGELRLVRLGLGAGCQGHALDALIRDALAVSERSWQGRGRSGGTAISGPSVAGFFGDVSRQLGRRGMLELSLLYLSDRPVSFIWGAARWPVTTISKLAFDAEYANLSPGLAHLALLIRDSIERGVREIDFGHEFPEYKRRWGREGYELCLVRCYAGTPAARLLDAWHRRPDWARPSYWRGRGRHQRPRLG